ncbi:MAG TPA: hypothetical protein VG406_14615 [Isosphaeraceae bacterium]|jgi:hypothetical protein|nr:hypothetical protein [Isosphaeraceae bacterium]
MAKLVHGFAWYAYPDPFRDESQPPGHPFGGADGAAKVPDEVVFYRPLAPGDAGIHNEIKPDVYLVVTRTMLHPKINKGWEVDPALLTEKFKTGDEQVRMTRVIKAHKTRCGEVTEGEFRLATG